MVLITYATSEGSGKPSLFAQMKYGSRWSVKQQQQKNHRPFSDVDFKIASKRCDIFQIHRSKSGSQLEMVYSFIYLYNILRVAYF